MGCIQPQMTYRNLSLWNHLLSEAPASCMIGILTTTHQEEKNNLDQTLPTPRIIADRIPELQLKPEPEPKPEFSPVATAQAN